MELCSFWVINPADGQEGKPEPVKITFFDNGDVNIVSLAEDPDYRGAYKLPCGSYSYSGGTLSVSEENVGKIIRLATRTEQDSEFLTELYAQGLINDREWDLFYANPPAWKSLKIVVINFGKD